MNKRWFDTRTRFRGKGAALALLCAASVGVTQADSVQVNVNRVPSVCARLLSQVRQDHIPSMTMEQFCSYDFLQRHAGSDYPALDWQPVKGDPIALTMMIYDANMAEVMPLQGMGVKERELVLANAKEQDHRHALLVEGASFTLRVTGKAAPTRGYVLRSRGSYCGVASGDEGSKVRGLNLVAFFADKEMKRPISNFGRDLYTKSFPIENMVVGIDASLLHYHAPDRSGAGSSYSIDLVNVGIFYDSSGSERLYSDPVCDYTIFVKAGVR